MSIIRFEIKLISVLCNFRLEWNWPKASNLLTSSDNLMNDLMTLQETEVKKLTLKELLKEEVLWGCLYALKLHSRVLKNYLSIPKIATIFKTNDSFSTPNRRDRYGGTQTNRIHL